MVEKISIDLSSILKSGKTVGDILVKHPYYTFGGLGVALGTYGGIKEYKKEIEFKAPRLKSGETKSDDSYKMRVIRSHKIQQREFDKSKPTKILSKVLANIGLGLYTGYQAEKINESHEEALNEARRYTKRARENFREQYTKRAREHFREQTRRRSEESKNTFRSGYNRSRSTTPGTSSTTNTAGKKFSETLKGFKTKTEATSAFRNAAKKYHPDKGGKAEDFYSVKTIWDAFKNSAGFNKLSYYKAFLDELEKISGCKIPPQYLSKQKTKPKKAKKSPN